MGWYHIGRTRVKKIQVFYKPMGVTDLVKIIHVDNKIKPQIFKGELFEMPSQMNKKAYSQILCERIENNLDNPKDRINSGRTLKALYHVLSWKPNHGFVIIKSVEMECALSERSDFFMAAHFVAPHEYQHLKFTMTSPKFESILNFETIQNCENCTCYNDFLAARKCCSFPIPFTITKLQVTTHVD